ncbi:hypothetical protein ABGT22_26250 [Peribacillus frigoritolerans]|uniref:hypothetical protein n=1 Tax=Peribacillus frigoritolerans TaxID=450367 RepID=UPI00345CB3E8
MNVVDNIKKVRDADGDRDDMVEMLSKLGDIEKKEEIVKGWIINKLQKKFVRL